MTTDIDITEHRASIQRLGKDLREAATTLSDREARFLVDSYYQMQRNRIRDDHQRRKLDEYGEPHDVLTWLSEQDATLEKQLQAALDRYSASKPIGHWMRLNKGIGPVIAAGLMCHININKAVTVGNIWRFAGLNPEDRRVKGQKSPWNGSLKTLCWKMGESFVKVSGSEDALYGQLYKARKELEIAKNEAGQFSGQAAAALEAKNYGKTTEAYKAYASGKLPPAHINARAKRYAVKMFLSHMHLVWWYLEHGTLPAKPYILTPEGGHTHYLLPPHIDAVHGLRKLMAENGYAD